ncbi:MAG: gamma-glutamylcyclotransferase [Amylibacter sp.]|nr:gamma-glutamylcyclotransferase [Amylibacter sp.]
MVSLGTEFFGYGSLVNLATHNYLNPRKASVQGWRRQWVYSLKRDVSFLSVSPDPTCSISGLVADVAHIGWEALDKREVGYNRFELDGTALPKADFSGVQIYSADPDHVDPAAYEKPILLSYIDCVVQGFLEHFGEAGVAAFFDTTAGWERSIKDDRTAPIYPRAQILTDAQTKLVDRHLSKLPSTIVS